jgi:hypothetical protein
MLHKSHFEHKLKLCTGFTQARKFQLFAFYLP